MLTGLLSKMTRACAADAPEGPRGLYALVRYAVLGLVALSVLPASAAQFKVSAQDNSQQPGGAEARQSSEQQKPAEPPGDEAAEPRVRVNTQLLKAVLLRGRELYDAGQLDLSQPFEASVEAGRGDDGALTSIVLTAPADERLAGLARELVDAVSASHILYFLEGARQVSFHLLLDWHNVSLTARAGYDSEERAAQMSDAYQRAIPFLSLRRGGTPGGQVWKNMTTSSSGKQLALKLEMSREEAGNLLLQQITPN